MLKQLLELRQVMDDIAVEGDDLERYTGILHIMGINRDKFALAQHMLDFAIGIAMVEREEREGSAFLASMLLFTEKILFFPSVRQSKTFSF